jgi:hypothetical protein
MDEFTIESVQGSRRGVAQISHRSRALRAIKSNTGCGSPGEADIALSTSIVAD